MRLRRERKHAVGAMEEESTGQAERWEAECRPAALS